MVYIVASRVWSNILCTRQFCNALLQTAALTGTNMTIPFRVKMCLHNPMPILTRSKFDLFLRIPTFSIYIVLNRPGVAGADLQRPPVIKGLHKKRLVAQTPLQTTLKDF